MALNMKTNVLTEEKKVVEAALPSAPETMILELSLYEIYNYCGTVYRKGTGYRFKREDAITLLGERDCDRPVWRQHRPKVKVQAPKTIVDSTKDDIHPIMEPIPGSEAPQRRIDVGDDSEIEDILSAKDGDVEI